MPIPNSWFSHLFWKNSQMPPFLRQLSGCPIYGHQPWYRAWLESWELWGFHTTYSIPGKRSAIFLRSLENFLILCHLKGYMELYGTMQSFIPWGNINGISSYSGMGEFCFHVSICIISDCETEVTHQHYQPSYIGAPRKKATSTTRAPGPVEGMSGDATLVAHLRNMARRMVSLGIRFLFLSFWHDAKWHKGIMWICSGWWTFVCFFQL